MTLLPDNTVDGIRLRAASVERSLVLRFVNDARAASWARDFDLLGCHVVREGRVVTVTGAHDALEEIERMLTKKNAPGA